MNDIDLLLAEHDTGAAVLSDGLGMDAAANGTPPKKKPEGSHFFINAAADPNLLDEQGWGVVVPEGPEGERLLALIDPLVKLRAEQGGGSPKPFKVPKGMDQDATWKWFDEQYACIPDEQRPRYLLILGGADLVSWDFQTTIAADVFAGRLAFQRDEDYAAYADKVLRHERTAPTDPARALYFTVRDGTGATTAAYDGLMLPTVAAAHRQADAGKLHAKEITLLNDGSGSISPEDFLAAAGQPGPTMMFSVSHGLGNSARKPWRTVEEQQRFQGAMSFGAGQRLTHEDVANVPFLPGGAWFFFACLGAGTPGESAYKHWLVKLKELRLFSGSPDDVLLSLPKPGQAPFVAALPQAALANPNGPLAVFGHVDLAWTFSFQKYTVDKNNKTVVTNDSRFDNVFLSMIEGKRMGAGSTQLGRLFNIDNAKLTKIFDNEAKDAERGVTTAPDQAAKVNKATLWMERQDIAAYVLLGDPAVRLNVDPRRAQSRVREPIPEIGLQRPAAAPSPAEPPAAPPPAAPAATAKQVKKLDDLDTWEEQVLEVAAGNALPKDVAAKLGVDKSDVQAWVKAYKDAGREALRKL